MSITKDFSLALYTKFSSSNSLNTLLNGRLYKEMAPQTPQVYPYATYHLISGTHEWGFREDYENLTVQINLYSNKNSSSEIEDLFDALVLLFDWCTLAIPDQRFLFMRRESANLFRDEDEIFIYAVTYRIRFYTNTNFTPKV
jgi:Protein of unknown function (DUF3168)